AAGFFVKDKKRQVFKVVSCCALAASLQVVGEKTINVYELLFVFGKRKDKFVYRMSVCGSNTGSLRFYERSDKK
ncbi:MAG: hypothetical protein ACD_24C00281G0001, partial [uncultured bacterium]